MNKKKLLRRSAMISVLLVAGIFLFCDLGWGLSPLVKFFIVFFGIIVGMQSVPAVLLFTGMVKGVFASRAGTAKQVVR
mgnify:CR=1 FL=1